MSILYTITAYAPSIGGAQLHLHEFVKRVRQVTPTGVLYHWNTQRTDWLRGTTLDSPTLDPPAQPDLLNDVPTYPLWMTAAQRKDVRRWVYLYWVLQSEAIEHIAATLLGNMNAAIPRLLTEPPQLVHNSRVGREGLTIASLRYARSCRIPFVFTPNHHHQWRGWFYRHYIHVFRSADAVIVHTPVEAEELARLGVHPDRLTVIGIGPILAKSDEPPEAGAARFRARHNIPDDAPLVLFLGQKYRYKRFDLILKAMPEVWKRHPAARFVFIGPRTAASQKIFAALHDPRMIELDTVTTQEKTDAIAACDLLCMPSHRESFGGVYVEAWMLDKPVIGGDAPAVQNLITNGVNGFTVGDDPALLARRIHELLSDPAMRAEMGREGRCVAERYSWDTLTESLLDVYRRLL